MNFIDKHETFAPTTSYAVTNEEPEVINLLLGTRKFNKVAGIASSGDILLLCLLQRAVESIVAVDHSYYSLYNAYAKALLLKKIGVDKLRDLLLNQPPDAWYKTLATVKPEIPASIKGAMPYSDHYTHTSLRREWFYTPKAAVKRGLKNIGKLSFVHGDVTDLTDYGPFDLLYTSNAHEHISRTKAYPKLATFAALLNIGGTLFVASNSKVVPDNPAYRVTKTFSGLRTSWHYHLIERTA